MSHIPNCAQYLEKALKSKRRSFHTRGITLDDLITLCESQGDLWTIVDQGRVADDQSTDPNTLVQCTLVHHVPSGAYLIHREVVRVDENGDETPVKLINCLRAVPRHGHAPFWSVKGEFERICFEPDGRYVWRNDNNATTKHNGKVVTHWPFHWSELTVENAEGGE